MFSHLESRIRVAIGGMADQEFEHFMSALLPKINSDYVNLEPSLNHMGKTTKGKCDAHVYHATDDTYTAIICTTQQTDLQRKVIEDIDKLASAKFAPKIRRVIICLNTPIKDEIEVYRRACLDRGWQLESLSLERILKHALANHDLLTRYFGEPSPEHGQGQSWSRRFDCGPRLQQVRNDLGLPVSRLIEELDFPGEKEWKAIEAGELELQERYVKAICTLSGCSEAWLKHEASPRYLSETLYYDDLDRVDALASEAPVASFVVIDPKHMNGSLVVQLSEFRWKVFSFTFSLDFWCWIDDHHRIPDIFQLLKRINDKLRFVRGKVANDKLMSELLGGEKHPARVIKQCGGSSYWFDDMFDIEHQYSCAADGYRQHGDWFVKLQNALRTYAKR